MKSSDRVILAVLAGLGVVLAFWFLVLSPKRAEVGELDDQVAAKQAEVSAQEQLATMAQSAKEDYAGAYHELVVLGKAVPGSSDQASLVEQVNEIAQSADVVFQGLVLSGNSGESEEAAEAAAPPPADPSATADAGSAAPAATPTPAPPTEATAATLPIGATVGSAGLPVMPYDLRFTGEFFETADFLAGIDGLVKSKRNGKRIGVSGRLLTVDGFSMFPSESEGFPDLDTNLHVTTYVAPADQGVTGGATPTEPAPSTALSTTTTPPAAVVTP